MKKTLLTTLFMCAFSTIIAQTLYTDELTGNSGMRLVVHEDDLYIGYGGSVFVDRLDLGSGSTTPVRVAQTGTSSPSFAFDYYPPNNSLFFATFGGNIKEADLDFPLPVTATLRVDSFNPYAFAQIFDDTLYTVNFDGRISTLDLTDPTYTYNLLHAHGDGISGAIAIWDGYLYYSDDPTFDPVYTLWRINLSDLTLDPEFVAPLGENRSLQGYQLDNYFYMSLDQGGKLVRYDLSLENPEPVTVMRTPIPGQDINGITHYNSEFYFILNNSDIYTFIDYSIEEYTPIADSNFEQYLIDAGFDTEGVLDNQILSVDALAVTEIEILAADNGITDFSGLEWFQNLESFTANHTLATEIDFSDLGRLTGISISDNTLLETIGLNGTTALNILLATNNSLLNLDLSSATQLSIIDVSNNALTALDLSDNPNLTVVNCSSNPLTYFDLLNGNNTAIVSYNSTNTPDLECIFVSDPDYSEANWTERDPASSFVQNQTQCDALTYVFLNDTNFEQYLIDAGFDSEGIIDGRILVTDALAITEISILATDNGIRRFTGIERFENLESFTANHTLANTIIFGNLNNLTTITLDQNNALSILDTSGVVNLMDFTLNNSNIFALDLSTNIAMIAVNCNDNAALSELDVQNGINTFFTSYSSTNTPNLTCIFVDDPAYSEANWTAVDPASTFVINEAECEELSVTDFATGNFVMYPVPAEDVLYFSNVLEENTEIEIYNVAGQLIRAVTSSESNALDVSFLAKGVYTITLRSDKLFHSGRFIKE